MLSKNTRFNWLIACAVLCSSVSWGVEPLAGSEKVHASQSKVSDHWIILGALERIKGAMRPEADLRVAGRLEQQMWQAPTGHTQAEAFNHVVVELKRNAVTLFECEGRQCGLSNDFANQLFQQRLLYGRDSDQLYWVGYSSDNKATLWVVYGIQRSNKRVYTFIESIKVDSESAKAIQPFFQKGQIQQFLQVGYRIVKPLDLAPAQLDIEEIDWMTELLRNNPTKKFALVVHRYGESDQDNLIQKTTAEAQGLVTQIAEAGGFIQFLYSFGAGAMVPRQDMGPRVELVELK